MQPSGRTVLDFHKKFAVSFQTADDIFAWAAGMGLYPRDRIVERRLATVPNVLAVVVYAKYVKCRNCRNGTQMSSLGPDNAYMSNAGLLSVSTGAVVATLGTNSFYKTWRGKSHASSSCYWKEVPFVLSISELKGIMLRLSDERS